MQTIKFVLRILRLPLPIKFLLRMLGLALLVLLLGFGVLMWLGSSPRTLAEQEVGLLNTLVTFALVLVLIQLVALSALTQMEGWTKSLAERMGALASQVHEIRKASDRDTYATDAGARQLSSASPKPGTDEEFAEIIESELGSRCDACGGPGPLTAHAINRKERQVCARCLDRLTANDRHSGAK